MIWRRIATPAGVREWEEPADAEAEPGRPHAGYDPEVARTDRLDVPADVDWWLGAARTPAEARSAVVVRRGPFARAATHLDALPELLAELPRAEAPRERMEPGEHPAVLGPDAVAEVLLAATRQRLPVGGRVAAATINLSQSPRFARQLQRSASPSPVIQDGVAHPDAPVPPRHLVLVGGGAASLEELAAPVAAGVLVLGAGIGRRIVEGASAGWVRVRLESPPLELLRAVRGLTRVQATIPLGDDPATIDATVAPALRVDVARVA